MTIKENGVHIILCDDDEDDRIFFEMVAVEWNPDIRVKTVESPDELLDELKQDGADFVFLDLNMPDISGKACLKMIRGNAAWENLPVIMYSTSAARQDVEETFRSGASLFVRKPYSAMDLKRILEEITTMDKSVLLDRGKRKFLIMY